MPVAEHHAFEHLLLGKLLGFRFDHHHGVGRAGDDEVEVAIGHLVEQRVQHVLAADETDARGADGAEERHARQGQRRRRGDQRQDVGVVLHVVREHGDDDLRLVLEAFDEQRTDRPVDEAGGERLLLGGTAFTLEEAAGDLARSVGLLLVVHGEGEEIDAGLRGLRGDDGGENAGLAVLGVNGRVGLARDAPGLERQLASTPVNFHAMDVEHVRFFLSLSDAQAAGMPDARAFGRAEARGGWPRRMRAEGRDGCRVGGPPRACRQRRMPSFSMMPW